MMRFLIVILMLASLANCSRLIEQSQLSALTLAPAPSGANCSEIMFDMLDCIPYLTAGSSDELPKSCCTGFESVLSVEPKCSCEGLDYAISIGIEINFTKSHNLARDCKISDPHLHCNTSSSHDSGGPAGSPSLSPSLSPSEESPTPATGAPEPGKPITSQVPPPSPGKAGAYSISISFFVLVSLLLVSFSSILA